MIIEAALEYIAQGIPVLPLYTITEAGCTCGDVRCKSPGKHPREDLVPHGVKDATLDSNEVMAWPQDINIGAALGEVAGGLTVFDVDEPSVVSALLHPTLSLSDRTAVATSARGCHIWVRARTPTRTLELKSANETKLGGIRSDGAYVVVPPSMSYKNRPYMWVRQAKDDYTIHAETTNDALAYFRDLLEEIDIEIEDKPDPAVIEQASQITACDLPEGLRRTGRLFEVRQILAGHVPTINEADRSGKLFGLGALVAKVALERSVGLTIPQLSGILKQADAVYYNKFTGRADADLNYWRMASRILVNGATPVPPAEVPTSVVAADAPTRHDLEAGDYVWDATAGALYYAPPRSRVRKKIANYLPRIVQDIEIDRGDEQETAWRVTFELVDGRSATFLLGPRDMRQQALEEAIRRSCSSAYITAASAANHVVPALQELSTLDPPSRRHVVAVCGWTEYGQGHAYIVPGAVGAITKDGLDLSLKIEPENLPAEEPILSSALACYGKGVRPPVTDEDKAQAWAAFEALVECGPPEITFLLALQVLSGPLGSLGVRQTPPLVHLTGSTGSLKTSLCLATLSLVGTFNADVGAPVHWNSTPNFIQLILNTARDTTILFDDYKRRIIKPTAALEIIQTYADASARGRATPDQRVRQQKPPRGLILSNGEDTWESESSAQARSIVAELKPGAVVPEKLAIVQQAINDGYLQMFGGAYLQWLAGSKYWDGSLATTRARLISQLRAMSDNERVHLRLPGMLAALLVSEHVVEAFVRDTWPEQADKVRGWARLVLASQQVGLQAQQLEVEEAAPFAEFARAVTEALASGEACLLPAKHGGARVPANANARAVGVGYWLEDYGHGYEQPVALFTRATSFAWYERGLRQRGDTPAFGWRGLVREIVTVHGGDKANMVSVYKGTGARSQLSGVVVPLDKLVEVVKAAEGEEPEAHEEWSVTDQTMAIRLPIEAT